MLISTHGKPRVEGYTVRHFPPGIYAEQKDFEPGDFILTHGKSFISWAIRWGQKLRYHGNDKKYTWWNHAAMIVTKEGELVEALGVGVRRSHISKYAKTDYHLIKLGSAAKDIDRDQVVGFANWCLDERYGFVTIISIVMSLVIGGKFNFGFDGQQICSGLVARALERTWLIFDRTPSHVMPADLAKYFNVQPPPPGSSRGIIPEVKEDGLKSEL